MKINVVYRIACFLLFGIEMFFLIFLIGSKIFIGRVLYYGGVDQRNVGYESYFDLLMLLQNCLWVVLIFWVILTLNEILTVRFKIKKPYIKIGLLGFGLSIVYALVDPFGLIKYFID